MNHYGKEGHEIHGMTEGTVMTVDFQLEGPMRDKIRIT